MLLLKNNTLPVYWTVKYTWQLLFYVSMALMHDAFGKGFIKGVGHQHRDLTPWFFLYGTMKCAVYKDNPQTIH